jgi:DNA-3-methyladenine glycosylase
MYNCFNVVTNVEGEPEAVLVRALEPRDGTDLMASRRGAADLRKLCSGPGKLCSALGITRADYGCDLCSREGGLFIAHGETIPEESILATPRINVDYAGEAALLPYRFVIRDSRYLSRRVS